VNRLDPIWTRKIGLVKVTEFNKKGRSGK